MCLIKPKHNLPVIDWAATLNVDCLVQSLDCTEKSEVYLEHGQQQEFTLSVYIVKFILDNKLNILL